MKVGKLVGKRRESKVKGLKKSLFRTKRFLESEIEENELKKKARNGSVKPKGYFARKLGVLTFWMLFGFMFLVVLVTMFSSSKGEAKKVDNTVAIKKNYAASEEAIQYAIDFTKDYFTWNVSDDGKNKRKSTMSKYLAEGLDQYAGLNFNGLEWNSKFIGAELKKVKEKGNDLAEITLLVNYELKKNNVAPDQQSTNEVKQSSKYFVVPVAYDGKTLGVYELPKFTYVYEKTTLKEVTSIQLKQADVAESEKIKKFLTTFFRSFAEDPKDKFDYILANDNVTDGLNNSMKFQKVNKADVFKGEKNNSFVVFTEVSLLEPETNVSHTSNYQLTVVKKDGKYIVSGLDDHSGNIVKQRNQSKKQ